MDRKNLVSLFPFKYHHQAVDIFSRFKNVGFSGVGNFSSKCFFIGDILRNKKDFAVFLWIVNDYAEAEQVQKMAEIWFNYDVYMYDFDQERKDSLIDNSKLRMIELASFLQGCDKKILVMPYKSLLRNFPDKKIITENIFTLDKKNGFNSITEFFQMLIKIGYKVAQDEKNILKGEYLRRGDSLLIHPVNSGEVFSVDLDFEQVGGLYRMNQSLSERLEEVEKIKLYPVNLECGKGYISAYLPAGSCVLFDELEVMDELYDSWNSFQESFSGDIKKTVFTPFLEDEQNHLNLHYTSVLQFRSVYDFVNDLKDKNKAEWTTVMFTKHPDRISQVFNDNGVSHEYTADLTQENDFEMEAGLVQIIPVGKDDVFPQAFQNPREKICILTDREFLPFKDQKETASQQRLYLDFLTSLKVNDFVVHVDYGIAQFQGLERKTVEDVTREYLKLAYAENDKLYVPIDQAEKVSKFIGSGEQVPRLTRLGSTEWSTITNRVKKETQKIAKELLELYAERANVKGFTYRPDDDFQRGFESQFPYEETPGQIRAILDVKADMESNRPMDRLICGDVGFGKTEVALRASFKAVRNGKQVAFISPITILADQHYRSFTSRVEDFPIKIEMLSRFRSKSDQKRILKDLEDGKIDVIIGTHRLLQEDVKFKDLGLAVIDEEQRFGVKQKETFKKMRAEVDIITLTATPIPRTLNISLNKLRDITIITTPPPGRLPVITEVRRFSNDIIREVILREKERNGQVYFLHNRVQTIDSMADKLRALVPEAKFIVAHGKLGSGDLEERIIAFKEGRYDVLVSSTIIENGIDLPNANTLIVNNADRFGLAQLYQLRGRVGRSRKQAYAYFLYHTQRLPYEAKKRLRAIVEASELGSGFQIAMKDLEIRGAGDILGANQHGAINVVGVSHFVRMLNQAVEDLKSGKKAEAREVETVAVELPLTCFIPDHYIVNAKEKVVVYQKLSSADNKKYLAHLKDDLIQEYGRLPKEVNNLFRILELKLLAKAANLTSVKAENIHSTENKEIVLSLSDRVRPENIMNLLEYNPCWIISGSKLKIKAVDLGMQWFEELEECIKRLGLKIDVRKKRVESKSEPSQTGEQPARVNLPPMV